MSDHERVRRGEQARMALSDFLAPAFAVVEADYAEKMIDAAASTDPRAPDVIARLANGIKVARQVRAQIEAIVHDGVEAKNKIERTAATEELSPARLRLLKIGAI